MTFNLIFWLLTIVIIVIIIYFFVMDKVQNVFWNNKKGHSISISDSKYRKVFIKELFTTNKTLKIESIWIEKNWRYGSKYNKSIQQDGYFICILFKENLRKDYNIKWFMALNKNNNIFSLARNNLLTKGVLSITGKEKKLITIYDGEYDRSAFKIKKNEIKETIIFMDSFDNVPNGTFNDK
jgi:hypothetical protein